MFTAPGRSMTRIRWAGLSSPSSLKAMAIEVVPCSQSGASPQMPLTTGIFLNLATHCYGVFSSQRGNRFFFFMTWLSSVLLWEGHELTHFISYTFFTNNVLQFFISGWCTIPPPLSLSSHCTILHDNEWCHFLFITFVCSACVLVLFVTLMIVQVSLFFLLLQCIKSNMYTKSLFNICHKCCLFAIFFFATRKTHCQIYWTWEETQNGIS